MDTVLYRCLNADTVAFLWGLGLSRDDIARLDVEGIEKEGILEVAKGMSFPAVEETFKNWGIAPELATKMCTALADKGLGAARILHRMPKVFSLPRGTCVNAGCAIGFWGD